MSSSQEKREPTGADGVEEASWGCAVVARPLEVHVNDGRIDRAVRKLRKRLGIEGVLGDMRRSRTYLKPSIRQREKQRKAARRRAKQRRMSRSH